MIAHRASHVKRKHKMLGRFLLLSQSAKGQDMYVVYEMAPAAFRCAVSEVGGVSRPPRAVLLKATSTLPFTMPVTVDIITDSPHDVPSLITVQQF